MEHLQPQTKLATHSVTNQPLPFENVNVYDSDVPLREAVLREGAGSTSGTFSALGARIGSAEVQQWVAQANRIPPLLRTFDRFGQRIDEVEFHPAWHHLMAQGIEAGVGSIAWTAAEAGHVAHSTLMYLLTQADPGVCCPFSMTYAAIPALRHQPDLAAVWEPRVLASKYDPRCLPAEDKSGVTIGMAMTEKQGGSDVRANTTRAIPLAAPGEYELVGHKWFCSAPMSDAFLTLAQTDAGLTCFLVPRWRPDRTRNALHIVRLKDKLGDRSNASAEIEYHGAWAKLAGPEGQGIRTIIDMVQGTRLDCMVGSAALMRGALANAIWHCSQRQAFGLELVQQPVMARVLADLALEQEAALALSFRVARAFDDAASSDHAAALARIVTPIAKYWICKRAPGMVYEAMECLGGNGYVEESPLPRLFRQSPLNSIWEGSGNVIALDTLRAALRSPGSLEALFLEVDEARGFDGTLDDRISKLKDLAPGLDENSARYFVESAALLLQAATLVRGAPSFVAEGFVSARLSDEAGYTYGACGRGFDTRGLLSRAMPQNGA